MSISSDCWEMPPSTAVENSMITAQNISHSIWCTRYMMAIYAASTPNLVELVAATIKLLTHLIVGAGYIQHTAPTSIYNSCCLSDLLRHIVTQPVSQVLQNFLDLFRWCCLSCTDSPYRLICQNHITPVLNVVWNTSYSWQTCPNYLETRGPKST